MNMPLPVTVIGGYLGAGKTTLVNQMLRQADGTRICVLVNEFGELPIDEDLIEAKDDNLISIAGGCICCSFGSDLAAALKQLSALNVAPDHIVIEASGVALPAGIAHTVDLMDGLQLASICVLADGLNIQAMSRDEYIGDTIERQLNDADVLVLTKSDLLSDAQLQACLAWIESNWPEVPTVVADQGLIPNSVLLGSEPTASDRKVHPHADAKYDSLVLGKDAVYNATDIARQLTDKTAGVIRAKGYLNDVSGQRALVQVTGRRSEVTFPSRPGRCGLVCIGLKDRLDKARVQKVFSIDVQ